MASTTDEKELISIRDEQGTGRKPAWQPYDRLYFITMDDAALDPVQQVEMACRSGIRWIQLRMKNADEAVFLEAALAARRICADWDCALIINDRVEVARAIKAHGVHVGKQDLSVADARRLLGADAIVGGTANTFSDVLLHYKQGADYVGVGPYRYTTTKKNLSPLLGLIGYKVLLAQLQEAGVTMPLVAIGGITQADVHALFQAGVQGIAFSGMLVHAAEPSATVRALQAAIF